jgi:sirohydrochlorin cobaltochelatase
VYIKNAILLAMFGTSEREALPGLLNIRARTAARFPGAPLRMAFTSAAIRCAWHQRAQDREFRRLHPEVPDEVFGIQGVREVVASLRHAGCSSLVLQPVHMAPGGDYHDLLEIAGRRVPGGDTASGLFARMAVGRPVLGRLNDGGRTDMDIARLVRALNEDVQRARQRGSALLYMGHGSRDASTADVYMRLAAAMAGRYPEQAIHFAMLEERPSLVDILPRIRAARPERIMLKPLMIAAGRHARRDMAGSGPDSWRSVLEKEGFMVDALIEGLGQLDDFAAIFAEHIADAADETGINLERGESGDNVSM